MKHLWKAMQVAIKLRDSRYFPSLDLLQRDKIESRDTIYGAISFVEVAFFEGFEYRIYRMHTPIFYRGYRFCRTLSLARERETSRPASTAEVREAE